MGLNQHHHLSAASILQLAPFESRRARPEIFRKEEFKPRDAEPAQLGPDDLSAGRRTRIWEFGVNLHCSIIGTCLTTAELRHILAKLGIGNAAAASDHDLHSAGVMLAANREQGAKFLQKSLDRQHRVAITRFSKAKDRTELLAAWDEALKQGDIPGAYWAILTHPATTEDVVKKVFGDVHMLSHLVGAANRADIRRLRQLEEENAALVSKVERQQRQLRDGFADRDQAIRRLNDMLAHQVDERPEPADPQDDRSAADALVRDLNRRLAQEIARRARSHQRSADLAVQLEKTQQALAASERDREARNRELARVESRLAAVVSPELQSGGDAFSLSGTVVLYVGGRAHQIPEMRALVERFGATLLHHDGGIEHSAALLPGLVSRADRIVFPIDCISHEAVISIKRLCRLSGKIYEPVRTASLASLLSALPSSSEIPPKEAAE